MLDTTVSNNSNSNREALVDSSSNRQPLHTVIQATVTVTEPTVTPCTVLEHSSSNNNSNKGENQLLIERIVLNANFSIPTEDSVDSSINSSNNPEV